MVTVETLTCQCLWGQSRLIIMLMPETLTCQCLWLVSQAYGDGRDIDMSVSLGSVTPYNNVDARDTDMSVSRVSYGQLAL